MMNWVRCVSVAAVGCCIVLCGCRSKSPALAYLPIETPVAQTTLIEPAVEAPREAVMVEEIQTKEVLKRKFMYWKAHRLMNEGLKAFNQKDYPGAIEKLTQAEKILRQLAPGHVPSAERLQKLRKLLGACHRDYARALLKMGRARNDVIKYDQAETNIMAAVHFDDSLKPQAQAFIRDLKGRRYWAQFD